jgi:UDP-2,3-diacylglucosamine pyrophosphatase LpxH
MPARRLAAIAALPLALALCIWASPAPDSWTFAILGDRTGEAQDGVYERVWKQIAAERPAFILGVGDTIQGMEDASAEIEWRQVDRLLQPFRQYPLYLAPGNHDVWSAESERIYRQHTGRPLHYSFDYQQAHFTVLDNSRTDQLPPQELAFLEADLAAHATQPIKVIVSHRPSWLLNVAMGKSDFPLHELAKRYGVKYVIAGHIHQMLHLELDGVTYISMVSSGGHLRLSGAYRDGWFFGYALAQVNGDKIDLQIKEAAPPHGEGRLSKLADWGMAGLVKKDAEVEK